MAQKAPDGQAGVDAIRLLIERAPDVVKSGTESKDVQLASSTLQAVANAASPKTNNLLTEIIGNAKLDLELRRLATRAPARQ